MCVVAVNMGFAFVSSEVSPSLLSHPCLLDLSVLHIFDLGNGNCCVSDGVQDAYMRRSWSTYHVRIRCDDVVVDPLC